MRENNLDSLTGSHRSLGYIPVKILKIACGVLILEHFAGTIGFLESVVFEISGLRTHIYGCDSAEQKRIV